MDREELLKKIEELKRRKRALAEDMIKEMTDDFIKRTGSKPKYVEVW